MTSLSDQTGDTTPAAWGAVLALSPGAFALVASEFMPVSLLTPIATDLAITEGQAGQSLAISGAFAMVTSLSLGALTGRTDRRHVLLALVALMMGSGTAAALAPNCVVFLVGSALIGVAIGGFWSLSAAVGMRLDAAARAMQMATTSRRGASERAFQDEVVRSGQFPLRAVREPAGRIPWGSTRLSLAVSISVYAMAAAFPPASEPTKR